MKMSKHFLTVILLCLWQLTSCQSDKSFRIYPFTADTNIAKELESIPLSEKHRLSNWYNHYFLRYAGDTIVYCVLSEKEDTLFVESTHFSTERAIPLNELPKPIDYVYYHNDDSIFVFYKRFITKSKTAEGKYLDFLLMDGTGKILSSYNLDCIPNIRNEVEQVNAISLTDCNIPDRMIDGKMLLFFQGSRPSISESGYDTFNPPLAALYDFKTGQTQMLNIRIPHQMLEEKYLYQHLTWIQKSEDSNLLLGFNFSPYIYKYDMQKDTMVLINRNHIGALLNVDSASMKKDRDYMFFRFNAPEWASTYACYIRDITIMHCSGYRPYSQITELMDKNFRHIAYLVGNKEYKAPYVNRITKRFVSYGESDHRPHYVYLGKKTQRISRKKWMETSLEKLPVRKKEEAMGLHDYLQKMQIQKGSLVLIINLKYPCGHCLDYLFSTMEQHKEEYAANNILYITYDPDYSSLTDDLLKRHRLKEAKNILQDNSLLDKVSLLDKPMSEGQYFLIDYFSIDPEHIRVIPMDFSKLQPYFESWSKQQMEKEKTPEE